MKEILRTDRLLLRELTEGDLDDLRELLQDRRVMYAYDHVLARRMCALGWNANRGAMPSSASAFGRQSSWTVAPWSVKQG